MYNVYTFLKYGKLAGVLITANVVSDSQKSESLKSRYAQINNTKKKQGRKCQPVRPAGSKNLNRYERTKSPRLSKVSDSQISICTN